jgi:hypothetical protein
MLGGLNRFPFGHLYSGDRKSDHWQPMVCMDEQIDAVALGLKRGPRGAVGLVFLMVALPLAAVATRTSERAPAEAAPSTRVEVTPAVVTVPPAAKLRSRAKRMAQPKVNAPEKVAPAVVVTSKPEPVSAPVTPSRPMSAPLAAPESAGEPPPAPAPEPAAKLVEEEDERDGNEEAIARSIAASKRAAVRACFESELKQFPKLHGTVVVELDLAPPNRVNSVRVKDDLERAAFTSCVEASMKDVKFGALDEEISVRVPYVLTPAAK